MIYTFKSKASGNLIMLEPVGRRVLQIIGKDAGPRGIILPAQMPAAIAALHAAVVEEEAARGKASQDDEEDAQDGQPGHHGVSLRQRAAPFIELMQRSLAEQHEVVWGV